jgi:ABC-type dipeptide/oligopeptide/nickel transport system permease subunit
VAEITVRGAVSPSAVPRPGWARFADSDLWWSFRRSPVTVVAASVACVIIGAALLAPLIAPHDPYDLASVSLLDATDPPAWLPGGNWSYLLGTDNQGHDVLSTIFYGTRVSLLVGCSSAARRCSFPCCSVFGRRSKALRIRSISV